MTPAVTIDDENEIEDEEDTTVSMDEILAGSNRFFGIRRREAKKLIAKGIPEGQIRFIHDAKNRCTKGQTVRTDACW
ncbi:hypothetical protein ACFS07_36235 [Undibacterium arcticum]